MRVPIHIAGIFSLNINIYYSLITSASHPRGGHPVITLVQTTSSLTSIHWYPPPPPKKKILKIKSNENKINLKKIHVYTLYIQKKKIIKNS